jgi:hypothetical protein
MVFERFRRIGTSKWCCDSCINSHTRFIDKKSAINQLEFKASSPIRMRAGKKSNFSHKDKEERFRAIVDRKAGGYIVFSGGATKQYEVNIPI